MRAFITLLFPVTATFAAAQGWTYVGGSCTLISGSAETEFRSDGTAVPVSFEPFGMSVRAWNGAAWSDLPVPAGVSGLIGGFDLEMHSDVAFLAVSNSGLKVYRLEGGNWTALGTAIPGTWGTNYDLIIDNNGVPKVMNAFDRKLYIFDGSAWVLAHTFPLGSFPNTIGYHVFGDHTLNTNAANDLVFIISVNDRQLMRSFDGVVEGMVGDTIIPFPAFTPYTAHVFRNGSDELFVTFNSLGTTPFIRKFNGTAWTAFGDDTGATPGSGNVLLGFRGDDDLVLTVSGTTHKTVYACSGPAATFTALETLSHDGFAQFTDLDVNPLDGSVHATFNCQPTAAVMRYSGTSSIAEDDGSGFAVDVFPNPARDAISLRTEAHLDRARFLDSTGRCVLEERVTDGRIDVLGLAPGLYMLQLMTISGQRSIVRVVKE